MNKREMKDVWGWETQIKADRISYKGNRTKSALLGLYQAFPPTGVLFPLLLIGNIRPSRFIEEISPPEVFEILSVELEVHPP